MLDLHAPPYADYAQRLDRLRRDPTSWTSLGFAASGDEPGVDVHELDRWRVVHLLHLSATPADRDLIRYLLDQEILARVHCAEGAGDPLSMLSTLLLEFGDEGDAARFWRAKTANFDTSAGGYDIEFIVARLDGDDVATRVASADIAAALAAMGTDDLDALERYDWAQIRDDLPGWRSSLDRRYSRKAPEDPQACEAWAELFGDSAGVLHHGLAAANSELDRAYVYRRVGQHAQAARRFREAAGSAADAWERTSRLRDALSEATKAGQTDLESARSIDALRAQIESWNEVGLGRMSTEAVFEQAAIAEDEATGRALFRLAERWRSELRSFFLVGLEAALRAAQRWGSEADVERIRQALHDERARIGALD
ncbi:MAG: hypothetical protein R3B13_27805 [Polyangiaceae bacterium]